MSSSDIQRRAHPDELLAAYSLYALDSDDVAHVESHLEDCPQCRRSVAGFQAAAAQLALAAGDRQPDAAVRARVMEAIARTGDRAAPSREMPPLAHSTRYLLSVAAVIVVALFTLGIFMNIRISHRVESLAAENFTLVAQLEAVIGENSDLDFQLAQTDANTSYLADALHQLQLTSYWLANPANLPLTLKPRAGGGDSRGILLVGDNGHRAVLMVSGMNGRQRLSIYQIWLSRQGDRQLAGEVEVDDNGWGTTTLQPTESLFGFDKVELTATTAAGVAPGPDDMVLEGAIQFASTSESPVSEPWP